LSPLVILIVLVSTFMHATWNLLARYDRSERDIYHKMLIVIAGIGFVPAIVSELIVHSLTPLVWACVTGSAFCLAIYLYFLARAFESSDFTIVYPIARALPVVFVALIDVLRGRYLTGAGWLGIFMVSSGCILIPLRSFRDFEFRKYFNQASFWMLLTAVGTVGYTLLDKIAAETVRQSPWTAARYGVMYFTIGIIPYTLMLKIFKISDQKRNNNSARKNASWKRAIPAGILQFSAYWLILYAYQLSPYASYIVAFRQFSIVIGAILAFVIYKEEGVTVRMTGASLITLGLVLIGVWGR
jgi:drug/metabolite transporter (DMT)-like permease